MAIFLLDNNISFDDLNMSNDFSVGISIEPITHVIIPKKNYVHGKLHIIQDIIDMCCLIITSMVKKLLIKQLINIYLIMVTKLWPMWSMRLDKHWDILH